jgi:hypothetical protein
MNANALASKYADGEQSEQKKPVNPDWFFLA